VQRSYVGTDELPADTTVWWIEPEGVCRAERTSSEDDAGVEDWRGEEWIAAGGTALVFLPPWDPGSTSCGTVAGCEVPAREYGARPAEHGDEEVVMQEVSGPLFTPPRRIEAPELSAFVDAGDAEVLAWLGRSPFVLLYRLGTGSLVLVGDARILRNRWLDRADAAPLAMDLVRAFGVPRFDERSHGLHRERHPVRYLLGSAAVVPLAGVLVLALLYVWAGRTLPPRSRSETDGNAPVLDEFVGSLARLYAGTGDHERVLDRYRQLAAGRLRRYFGLPAETPLAALVERLARSGRVDRASLSKLTHAAVPSGASELRAAVRALDALVDEAMQ
jgi:hypothetical protein